MYWQQLHSQTTNQAAFLRFENERTLIWCQVCFCPRTEIISLSAHKRWVTRINQTLIHRIGQHGGEEKFTGAKCVICCQSLYAWWQCCAGFWSRTLGLYYYSCLIIMIFWPLLILEDPQSLWSVSCLGLISSQHEKAAVPNINIRFEKYRANMNLRRANRKYCLCRCFCDYLCVVICIITSKYLNEGCVPHSKCTKLCITVIIMSGKNNCLVETTNCVEWL